MSEPMLCVLTGAYCTEGDCPLYHDATLQCKFVMAIENILGGVTPAKERSQQPLIPGGPDIPDVSGIEWKVGKSPNIYEARPDDTDTWAFVYKYDAQAKRSTDVVRDECAGLVNYLQNNTSLELDGYKYTRSGREGNFLGRKKV